MPCASRSSSQPAAVRVFTAYPAAPRRAAQSSHSRPQHIFHRSFCLVERPLHRRYPHQERDGDCIDQIYLLALRITFLLTNPSNNLKDTHEIPSPSVPLLFFTSSPCPPPLRTPRTPTPPRPCEHRRQQPRRPSFAADQQSLLPPERRWAPEQPPHGGGRADGGAGVAGGEGG